MTYDQFRACAPLNVYDSPDLSRLATQMAPGRYFRYVSTEAGAACGPALAIQLVEDDYPGWLDPQDQAQTEPAPQPYTPVTLAEAEIQARLPQVIAFGLAAMAQPNHYLWGGTVGPNYDCSGLMQAAFGSVGIWLPRDAYQQEQFVQPLALADLQPGDLVFFGPADYRATHVGLVLAGGRYLHSSGVQQGRNGIGIDALTATADAVSERYRAQIRGGGRVVRSYCPTATV